MADKLVAALVGLTVAVKANAKVLHLVGALDAMKAVMMVKKLVVEKVTMSEPELVDLRVYMMDM